VQRYAGNLGRERIGEGQGGPNLEIPGSRKGFMKRQQPSRKYKLSSSSGWVEEKGTYEGHIRNEKWVRAEG